MEKKINVQYESAHTYCAVIHVISKEKEFAGVFAFTGRGRRGSGKFILFKCIGLCDCGCFLREEWLPGIRDFIYVMYDRGKESWDFLINNFQGTGFSLKVEITSVASELLMWIANKDSNNGK